MDRTKQRTTDRTFCATQQIHINNKCLALAVYKWDREKKWNSDQNERMWLFPLQEIAEAIIFNTGTHMPSSILASSSNPSLVVQSLVQFR